MVQQSLPVVAIVGRPNVGKSTLFNRIVGERTAVVEDEAGTTRDRLYGDGEWNDRRFLIVDTGGLERAAPGGEIELRVQEQARIAISEADVIVFVVDAAAGLTPADGEAADVLRSARAPVIVTANKADNARRDLEAAEFYELGWGQIFPISAAHGRGTGDLLDAIVDALPPESAAEIARKRREREADAWARDEAAGRLRAFVVGVDEDLDDAGPDELGRDGDAPEGDLDDVSADDSGRHWDALMAAEAADEPVAIAIVGRPNVGKSSLLNALLGEERAIVSDVPGTTRDATDTPLEWGRSTIMLIDTAGIRRRGRVASGPAADRHATLRSLRAISRADVAILVIDAVEGLTAQDAHVAGYVVDEGRGLVLAVNKWDLVAAKTDRTFDQYVTWIRREAPFLDFAPVLSISAHTGQRVERVLETAVDVWGERRKRVATAELNRLVTEATSRVAAPIVKGKRLKIFYATQAGVAPPTFVFFARDAGSVHFSYRRYLENRLREAFGFDGTPVRLVFRERSSVKLAPRGRRPTGAGSRSSRSPSRAGSMSRRGRAARSG
jgi:GTP-binding protein